MLVSLYQNNPAFGQVEKNLDEVLSAVADKSFDILVLPELFATGYIFESREEAISLGDIPGKGIVFDRLKRLAHERDALIIYGFPEIAEAKLFNSSMALFPDGTFKIYRKTHLFNTEKKFFDPGDSGFFVFEFKGARIGMMICFDWRFPEAARKLALLGSQVICHPSNLVLPHCPDAMITRALENNVFTITANRIGTENRAGQSLRFIGRSRIIAPSGHVLSELPHDKPGFVVSEIDPQLADNKQITAGNDIFADRRPEFY